VGSFAVDWQEIGKAVLVFVVLLLGFVLLSATVQWPNAKDGWPLAIAIALIIACVPLLARLLSFLQQSGATVRTPFGLQLDFSVAAAGARLSAETMPPNIVQPGVQIADSGVGELDRAAAEATQQTVVLIDVQDGRAWYRTRLFAIAGTGVLLGSPRLLMIIGQRGGKPLQLGGCIQAPEVVRGFIAAEPTYEAVLQRARRYLHYLRAEAGNRNPTLPADLPRLSQYLAIYRQVGDPLVMRILVDQMISPDQILGTLTPVHQALEIQGQEPWMTLGDAERLFDPWLIRDAVDLQLPQKDLANIVLSAEGEIIAAVREGQYAGIIDVRRAVRLFLRQLVR
jgi:hypothetical protein